MCSPYRLSSTDFAYSLTDELFQLIVKNVHWGAVVRFLKTRNLAAESPNVLSPLQRRLLLSMKAARQQFEEDGKISEDSLARWLAASDIPGRALVDSFKFLGRFAKSIMDVVSHSNRSLQERCDSFEVRGHQASMKLPAARPGGGAAICRWPAFFGRHATSSLRPAANLKIVQTECTESMLH
jgi:hypothetical protein